MDDLKKWAANKLNPPGAPAAPGAPPAPVGPPLFNSSITSAALPPSMAGWAQAGGTAPEHPMGQPGWADDATAYASAVALVKKNWQAYKEPWAVVALAYDALKAAKPAAPAAPAAPPSPPGPAGAPKPPPFGGAKPGFGKPQGAP